MMKNLIIHFFFCFYAFYIWQIKCPILISAINDTYLSTVSPEE